MDDRLRKGRHAEAVVNGGPVRGCDKAKQGYSCGDGVKVLGLVPDQW